MRCVVRSMFAAAARDRCLPRSSPRTRAQSIDSTHGSTSSRLLRRCPPCAASSEKPRNPASLLGFSSPYWFHNAFIIGPYDAQHRRVGVSLPMDELSRHETWLLCAALLAVVTAIGSFVWL